MNCPPPLQTKFSLQENLSKQYLPGKHIKIIHFCEGTINGLAELNSPEMQLELPVHGIKKEVDLYSSTTTTTGKDAT